MSNSPHGGTDAAQPAPPAPRLRIGLHVSKEQDLATFAKALAWFGDVRLIMDAQDLTESLDVDLVVAEVGGVDLLELGRLRTCRASNPDVPLLLLGRGVSGNIGVELVRLLGDDILLLPTDDENALFRKVERLLIGSRLPAFDEAYLAPLRLGHGDAGQERRRVIRADVPQVWRTWAIVEDLPSRPCIRIGDLSVPQADALGGLMLLADKPTAKALLQDVGGFSVGSKLRLTVTLFGDDKPLSLQARVARIPNPREGGVYPLGVQVGFANDADLTRFARFWTACLLQTRREDGALHTSA